MDDVKRFEEPIIHTSRKVNRIRQRKGLTLAPETISSLDKVIARGDATNHSRAIDVTVQFFEQNQGAFPTKLEKSMASAFVKKCVKLKKTPTEVLSMLAARWTLEES